MPAIVINELNQQWQTVRLEVCNSSLNSCAAKAVCCCTDWCNLLQHKQKSSVKWEMTALYIVIQLQSTCTFLQYSCGPANAWDTLESHFRLANCHLILAMTLWIHESECHTGRRQTTATTVCKFVQKEKHYHKAVGAVVVENLRSNFTFWCVNSGCLQTLTSRQLCDRDGPGSASRMKEILESSIIVITDAIPWNEIARLSSYYRFKMSWVLPI